MPEVQEDGPDEEGCGASTVSPPRRSPGEGSVFRRADGRWVGQVVVGHTTKGIRRRTVYGRTKGEVLRKLQKAQQEAGLGPVDRKATFGAVITEWLASRKPRLRSSTHENYTRILRGHTGDLWRVPVARLTPAAIERHLAALGEAKAGGRVIQYWRQLAKAVLRYAVRRGVVPVSPADGVESYPHRASVPAPWEPGEAAAFLAAAQGARLYPFFHLALATGLRGGELLGLQWSDLDLAAATLTVRHTYSRLAGGPALTEPKTERSHRVITLDPETVAILEERQRQWRAERALAEGAGLWRGTDYVFAATDGRPVGHTWPRKTLARIAKTAGVRRIRLHDLRHTYATLALLAGVQAHVVSERLGHSRVSITMDVYAGVLQEQRAGAALSLDVLLKREAVLKQHSPEPN
jgi:integrase